MKLRAQLIVVSLFALLLPWAGCSFVYEMESVLRSGQQDALAAVAGSVALLIEDRGGIDAAATAPDPRARPVYFYTAKSIPAVDGYPEVDDELLNRLVGFTEEPAGAAPLTADFVGVVSDAEAYLFIRVADSQIRYRNPADDDLAAGDHIVMAFGSADRIRRYWLAPEAPGEFLARYRSRAGVMTEPRIRAVWRDTALGYQVEVGVPLTLLAERFGFAAVDGANARRWAGNMPPAGRPAPLVRSDPALTALLGTFARDNLRLSLVDASGWIRARSGQLRYRAPEDSRLPPGGWILETVYRWLMAGDEGIPGIRDDGGARLSGGEVVAALDGRQATGWYRVDDARGAAVARVAVPIHVGADVRGALVAEQSSSRILSLTNAAVVRLLFLTLVATFLISFGLVLYASLLSVRIRRLGRSVDAALGEDGRISGAFPQDWARDEIGDLGRHFGTLLARMREYNDYLKSLASKLSHELRTPLAVVSSSLDNIADGSQPDSPDQYVARARAGVERLSRILSSMSEAGRVEQSIRSAEVERLDLTAFLLSNVAGFREAFARDIECSVPDEPIWVSASADLLAQAFDKLMDNAADFCPQGGRIAFALWREGKRAVIAVENDGPPLPEEMRGELFESMVSVRAGQSEKPHLGLGLTIVRLVAEFHGGTVRAGNREGGGGVRFCLELPIGPRRAE